MATVVRQIKDSDELEKQGAEGTYKKMRQYVVYDDTTATNFATSAQVKALFGTATTPDPMPNEGDVDIDDSSLVATHPRIKTVTDHRYLWTVTWFYDTIPPGGGVSPNTIGYVEFNTSVTLIPTDAWRQQPSTGSPYTSLLFPANGTPVRVGDEWPDIKGEPIDSAGEPGSFFKYQATLEITETIAFPVDHATYNAMVGRRNNSAFYGGAVGKVILAEPTTRRIALNKAQATFRFIFDEWYHMIQRPERDIHKNIVSYGVFAVVPADIPQARTVYWYQPFPDFGDFNAISNNW